MFCNESSKIFLSRVYYGFAKTQIPFECKKLKHLKKLVFHKHASSFLKRIFSKFWRCLKSRCLTGVLFFARFSTSEENRLPHNLRFFMRILTSVWDFKLISVHFQKIPENANTFIPTFKIQFWQTRRLISSWVRNRFLWKCEKKGLKKTIENFFFSKQSSVHLGNSVDNRFKNYVQKYDIFLLDIERFFLKKGFVPWTKTFSKMMPCTLWL